MFKGVQVMFSNCRISSQYRSTKMSRSVLAIAAGCLLSLNVFSQTMPDAPTFGSGSSDNPYQIYTFAQLKWIATDSKYWDKEYILMNDIDASETKGSTVSEWKRIGDGSTHFSGKFHGRGHTIKNLGMNQPTQSYTGMFGSIISPCVIDSLCLDSAKIIGKNPTGALVGLCQSAIIKYCCVTNVYVEGHDGVVGGLVGHLEGNGTVYGCFSTGRVVSNTQDCGGIVGWVNGSIYDCYSRASVTAASGTHGTGGVVGFIIGGTAKRCYATGVVRVNGGTDGAGGVVGGAGRTESDKTVIVNSSTDCFWDAQASGLSTSVCGTSKTTAEMKNPETFNTAYDFNTIWAISSAANDGYPFLRVSGIPVLETVSIKGILDSTRRMSKIICTGNLISQSMDNPSAHGFVYGTSPNPEITNSVANLGAAPKAGTFSATISGLSASDTTVYYVRAFATNAAGTFYGEQRAFMPGITSYHWQPSAGMQPVSGIGKGSNVPFLGKKVEGDMPIVADSTPLWLDKAGDGKRYVVDLKTAQDVSFGYTWGGTLTDQTHTFYVTAKNAVPNLSVVRQRTAKAYSLVRFKYANDTIYASHFDNGDWKATFSGLAPAITSDDWIPYFVHIKQVSPDSLRVSFGATNQEIASIMVGEDTTGGSWNAGSAYCWVTSDSTYARVSDVHVFSSADTMGVNNIWRAFFSPEYLDNGPLFRIPMVIHNIIYDPPGSDSYESCTFDTTTSTKYQFDFTTAADLSLEVGIKGSIDTKVGFFGLVQTGTAIDMQATVKGEYHYQYDHSHGTEFTFNNSTATTSLIDNVASEFMGPSRGDVVVYQAFAYRTSMMRRPYMSKFRTASAATDYVYATAGGVPVPDSCGAVYYKPVQTLIKELHDDSASLIALQKEYPFNLKTGKVLATAMDSAIDPITNVKKGPRLVKYEDTKIIGGNITNRKSINRGTTYFSDRKDTWGYGLTATVALWNIVGFETSVSSSANWSAGYSATSSGAKTLEYELKDNTSWDILKITPYTDTRFNTICFVVDSASSYTSFPVEANTRPAVDWQYSVVPACTAYVGQSATVIVKVTNTSPKAIVTGLPDYFKFTISAINFPGTFSVYPEDAQISIGQTVPFTFTFTGAEADSFLQEIRVDCWQPLTNGYSQYNSIKFPMVIRPADVGLVAVIPTDTVYIEKDAVLSNVFKVKLVNTGKIAATVVSGEVGTSTGTTATYSAITNPVNSGDTTLLTVTLTGDGKHKAYSATFWTQIQGEIATKSQHTVVIVDKGNTSGSYPVIASSVIRDLAMVNCGNRRLKLLVPENEHPKLRIFSINGKSIYAMAFNPGENMLNISMLNLPSGYYVLQLQGAKQVVRQRFIVSKK
jgi:hypothetical protein